MMLAASIQIKLSTQYYPMLLPIRIKLPINLSLACCNRKLDCEGVYLGEDKFYLIWLMWSIYLQVGFPSALFHWILVPSLFRIFGFFSQFYWSYEFSDMICTFSFSFFLFRGALFSFYILPVNLVVLPSLVLFGYLSVIPMHVHTHASEREREEVKDRNCLVNWYKNIAP